MIKKRSALIFCIVLLLITAGVSIIVSAGGKGGGGGGPPCDGLRYAGGYSYEEGACIKECGSPEACDRTQPGGKGKCEMGQVCTDECECVWADKDLDGYAGTSCGNYSGNAGWVDLGEKDVNPPTAEWAVSGGGVNADILRLTATRIGTWVEGYGESAYYQTINTKIYKIDVYDKNGLYKTYDYTSKEGGSLTWTTVNSQETIKFDSPVIITRVVVKWDDGSGSNAGKLELSAIQGSETCDCDDNNSYIHPAAQELCDNTDNDCNGLIDEGEVCEKNIYICKSNSFVTQHEGKEIDLSYGYCADGTWCSSKITGESGSCSYQTAKADIGKKEFYAYACDRQNCYKFIKGNFMVCGPGWDCAEICTLGECNFAAKEWCNKDGMWQSDLWCHGECGKYDSTCGGNCEQGTCDTYAGKWCNNGYWAQENYCNCDVCGNLDASCTTGCTCEDGACDEANKKYCDKGIWKNSNNYCLKTACCLKSYDCFQKGICDTCDSGSCDIVSNYYCLGGEWTSNDYCSYCESTDYDCGTDTCEHGNCDVTNKKYCQNGQWINAGASYCYPGYCGTQDTTCKCGNTQDGCCDSDSDDKCDPDCLEGVDPDCGECTASAGDCCDDTPGNGCDADCQAGVDPDCQTDCSTGSDDCCSGKDDGTCDPDCTENSDIDCAEKCTTTGGDCCIPDEDEICDPDCIIGADPNCAAHPCEEIWVCNEWDQDCDGIHETRTCLEWKDSNNCNTEFDKPTEEKQPCYLDFVCTKDDDKDKDGYPSRACYDAQKDKILEELDCDDNDASQNPNAEEKCNSKDDNCDDTIDEDCPCKGDETQVCGKEEGICKTGVQRCVAGKWSICGGSGYVAPQKEACDDSLDNNCDSYIDENCKCTEGEKQECGTDAGLCEKGWQACYNSTFGSVCNNETKGVTEVCDNSLDDDCDAYADGDDSNCQVLTPVTTGADHCKNRKQDSDETGVDCGGKDCTPCEEKSSACEYGKIKEKCVCGKVAYRTGYCCNAKYSLSPCAEPPTDADNDGCNDDKELKLGTDLYSEDTDGDGLSDCDPQEKQPLCNENGICEAERSYPETSENCPTDCKAAEEKAKISLWTWILLAIIILALLGIGGYLYAKSKGYKFSDLFKKGKKEEKKWSWSDILGRGTPTHTKERPVTKLKLFVEESLKKGYKEDQIRKSALKSGWTEEEINEALKGKKSKFKLF